MQASVEQSERQEPFQTAVKEFYCCSVAPA
jgi:hypothetical protein